MAGIYIHIPFCKKLCGYCDFYKSVDLGLKGNFIGALLKEIGNRAQEFSGEVVETIYFGGGTPSILDVKELKDILSSVYNHFDVCDGAEVSMEVNPDDINLTFLRDIHDLSFNRLSIGVQSFCDGQLALMGRRHNAAQVIEAVEAAQRVGFSNITIDLIYGIPGMTEQIWKENVEKAIALNIQHISAYHLTFEEGTDFFRKKEKGILKEVNDDEGFNQFTFLVDRLKGAGFYQYEISNFCQSGFESKHNASYWSAQKYAGFGPSAHSFNGHIRRWNVNHLKEYIVKVEANELFFQEEVLSCVDKFNEFVMLGLRTSRGINMSFINEAFSDDIIEHFTKVLKLCVADSMVKVNDGKVIIVDKYKFITDRIIERFFIV